MELTAWDRCRACGGKLLPGPSLGFQPIVDFADTPNVCPRGEAPLEMARCVDCELVQLYHSVHADVLFDTFWYRSGINPMMKDALASVAEDAQEYGLLKAGDWVMDIGCNDGTLFHTYTVPGLHYVGVDPAENVLADMKCPETAEAAFALPGYFTKDFVDAEVSAAIKYKAITSVAMFYDLDDPKAFLKDVYDCLAEDGVFVIQMNYLWSMLEQNAFDNICHEHVTYYGLKSLERLLEASGFQVTRVRLNDTNGGSIRVVCHKLGQYRQSLEDACSVANIRAYEGKFDLVDELNQFENRMDAIAGKLIQAVDRAPKPIWLYGASTRGHTLMQTLYARGLDPNVFGGVAERDERKYHLFPAGTGILICPEMIARQEAKTFLVLPWHFFAGIVRRESAWVSQGGELVVPLPKPILVTADGMREL